MSEDGVQLSSNVEERTVAAKNKNDLVLSQNNIGNSSTNNKRLINKNDNLVISSSSSHLTTIGCYNNSNNNGSISPIRNRSRSINSTTSSSNNEGGNGNGITISPDVFVYSHSHSNTSTSSKFYDSDHGSSDGSVIYQPDSISPITTIGQNITNNYVNNNNTYNNTSTNTTRKKKNNSISLSMLPYPQRKFFTNTITPSNLKQNSRNNNNNRPGMIISSGTSRIRTSSEEYNNTNTKSSYYPPTSTIPRNRIDSYDKNYNETTNTMKYNNYNNPATNNNSIDSYYGSFNSNSGNSAVLGTLSKQLATDVAYFFQRETQYNNNNSNNRINNTKSNNNKNNNNQQHRPLVSWVDQRQHQQQQQPCFSYNTFQTENKSRKKWHHQQSSSYFSDSNSDDENEEEYLLQYHNNKSNNSSNSSLLLDHHYQPYSNNNSSNLHKYNRSSSSSGEPTQENYQNHNNNHHQIEFIEQINQNQYYQQPQHWDEEENEVQQKYFTEQQYQALLYKKQLKEEIQRKKHKRTSSSYSLLQKILSSLDLYISNIPLTLGTIAYTFACLSTIWFKYFEEIILECTSIQYHSTQCAFNEYPNCYSCSNTQEYKFAISIHYVLLGGSFFLVILVCMKCILAPNIFIDDMSSPITAAPFGYICMCIVIVFAGKGLIGRLIVCFTSFIHLLILIWFIYLTLAYRTSPEPSWYPNTIGIGICAVKIWMYYPNIGILFMILSLTSCVILVPISLVRVALDKNYKLSSTICWMQMSAPSYALYALSIMGQPNTLNGEYPEGISLFQQIHRIIYLPFMHFFFALSVITALSSIYCVKKRWKYFMDKPFSPAYAAFACPQLTHANAIQSYRTALNSFSSLKSNHPYRIFITYYWILFLYLGTILSIYISVKYLYKLRIWVQQVSLDEEEEEIEPPAPNETIICNLLTIGDHFISSYVSPAILQANETGLLYKKKFRKKKNDDNNYKRTKRIFATGFIPVLNSNEIVQEYQLLLDYVANHPPPSSTILSSGKDNNNGGQNNGKSNNSGKNAISVPGIDYQYRFDNIRDGN